MAGGRRQPRLIVSLTCTAHRLPSLHLGIETLLAQSLQPDRIVLYLAGDPGRLPPLVRRQRARGLEIVAGPDAGSCGKLLPVLARCPEDVIVTADDDVFYPRHWLKALWSTHRGYPDCIVYHRGRIVRVAGEDELAPYAEWPLASGGTPGLRVLPTGTGGVLYPPGALHREVFNTKARVRCCPTADDIWFKAMSLLQGTRCVQCRKPVRVWLHVPGTQVTALYRSNRRHNDRFLRKVFREYGLFRFLV